MAMIEKKSEIENVKDDNQKEEIVYRVFPDIRRRVDYENYEVDVEISLPGVSKEDIELKALSTWFHIVGKRGRLEYSANSAWGAEIVPNRTKAKYNNGLLQIRAKIKNPLEDARKIEL